MSRLRKIYKGEENWDVMYNEQDVILGKGKKGNTKKDNEADNANNVPPNKKNFKEDTKNVIMPQNKENSNNIIDENELQDLILENLDVVNPLNNNNDITCEVNEKDYENFDEHLSEHSSVKLNQKRTYTEAFGEGYNGGDSLPEDEQGVANKKFK